MERGYRDVGRSSLADYDDYRSYSRQGRSVYADYESPSRDSYLGSPGSSYRSGRSNYSGGSSSFDRDIMESLVQQRALQQQLSLRESQLALANTLLQQQQQQQFLAKRRFDPRGDLRQDFKRPRMSDMRSRPRSRLTGGRDSSAGGRGSRGGSSYQRNQRSGGHLSSDRSRSRDKYDPEKPTADEDKEGSKDEEDLKKNMSSSEHKEQAARTQNKKNEGGSMDRGNKRYCNICDVPLDVSFLNHQRLTFHKKRKVQVTKGCGWCNVTSFKNFSEVLEHRATSKHVKNQSLYEQQDIRKRGCRGRGRSRRKREPINVELPAELDKFDPKVVVGQSCVIAVTGWFCKLCNKFYNNENAAKETHCMTEPHFNKYKEFMYTKLKAKAEAERDAREKAEEEERKKKEEEEEEKKKEGKEEEPPSEEPEGTVEEMADEKGEEHAGEETKQNGDEEEKAGAEEEEVIVEGEEEEPVEEMMGEPEEYVDDEDGMAGEEGLFEETQDVSEDHTGAEDMENIEDISQEEEPQVIEGSMEGEAEAVAEEEEEEVVEEVKEVTEKKTTRAVVSSPGRGRGRGGATNRARRGRRVAK